MFRLIVLSICIAFVSCGESHLLKDVVKIENYPSASGIEYFDNKFYVVGDDARNLLILDSNLQVLDSILLYPGSSTRISKDTKPDLESVSLMYRRSKTRLLLLGSGSHDPYRNMGWFIDPKSKTMDSVRLDTFYERLHLQGLKEINIEGASFIPGSFVLSNRGHKGYPRNYLIFTNPDFWMNQEQAPLTAILTGFSKDSTAFSGISGIAYARKSDRLVMTVSTEDTRSVYEDGAIGKSYLWIINSISSKKRWKSINPNQVIELDAIDPRFRGQKIESVCVIKETRKLLHLVLAADNDDGSSTLFKLIVEKD